MNETSNDNDGFLRLLIRYQEKSLTEIEFNSLNEGLRNDPKKRDLFINHCQLGQLIRDTENERKIRQVEFPNPARSRWRTTYGLAASVTIFMALTWWLSTNRESQQPEPFIAKVTQSVGARLPSGQLIDINRELSSQTLELASGLLRLDFVNGAKVGVEGPAKLEIQDGMNLILHSGVVTADIPDTAHGFTIHTEAAEVIDLGTAFGVSVSKNGLTDVCVFEGEVEIKGGLAHSTKRVLEGAAVRMNPGQNLLEDIGYDTTVYEKSWPITSGVLQTTGVMKFVSPGPNFVPGKYEDSERILVFPEQRDVLLEESINIDLSEPGEYFKLRRGDERLVLRAGHRVRSYLLQLNPVGQIPRGDPDKTVAIGQITFDSPILGIIGTDEKFTATDELLGHSNGNYGNAQRGVEARRKKIGSKEGRDTVILAVDRRTLTLNLAAGSALDQIRVLVAVE